MTPNSYDSDQYNAIILDAAVPEQETALAELLADNRVETIDRTREQLEGLRQLRPAPSADLTGERTRWAFYPWRRTVVRVLGPRGFRALRLDRNRNLITAEEQERLGRLRVGVIGLSVGHAIAYNLAAQRVCGELRLSDFDHLELPNLNRVPATVLDQGVNKAVVAARRISELDPYFPVSIMPSGITADSVHEFMDGVDIVVEECDSLDAKILVREAARARRIPVLMTTSDNGLLDVERFDSDPSRPIMHGLLGEVDTAKLAHLSSKEKIPYALRILDAARVSSRMAASLVEVGTTLTTWPQLASEVNLGAAIVTEAVRRIGLGERLQSGRLRVDAMAMLDKLVDPLATTRARHSDDQPPIEAEPTGPSHIVAAAANRAPSGGNAQPWHIDVQPNSVNMRLAPEFTSSMDVGYRASAVAMGAAVFNARVAAAANGFSGRVDLLDGDEQSPLRATVWLAAGDEPQLARLYEQMLRRHTNRHVGVPAPIADEAVEYMRTAAAREGARLQVLHARDELERAGTIIGAADRIRYLTPHLHAEMFSELRWPGDPEPDAGIDVMGLELDPADLVKLDILRRPEVMAHLARWDAGTALGDDSRQRITASTAIGVVSMGGQTLIDYARAGAAVEAVWIAAEEQGFAVQPVSPVFLYAHDDLELRALSPAYAEELRHLQYNLRRLAGTACDESMALVLRFSLAPRSSVRSRRRALRSAPSRQW